MPIALPVTPAPRPKPPIDVAAMAGVAGTGAGLTGPDDLARVTPAAVRERIREMLLASAIIHAVVALWATLAPPPPKLELARALELQSRFVALLVQPPTKPEVPPPTEANKASQKGDERRKPSQSDISRPPPAPADEGPSAGPEAPTSPPVALPGETDRGKDLLADLPGAAPSGVGAGATPRIGALEGMGDVNLPGADSASPGLGGLGIGRNPAGAISGGRAVGGGGAQGASGVAQPDGKEREAIRATFAEHRAQIQYCYETHGPRTRRDLRVEVRLTLVQRRMASRPKPRFKANTRLDPAFTTCLRTAIGQWSFKGVRPIPIGIKYPIVFRSNAE
ncbi:MAG: hypothetical protein KC620_16595 [Myxococcales bacterium]|nr:hypothetical protein [Myxococcales bacterium]